jgi:hypothetical protein
MSKAGRAGERKFCKKNRPPEGEPWIWLTHEMLASPAWRALSPNGLRVIVRVMIEHMRHAGTENGNLIVTHDDFIDYGIRRNSVADAIKNANASGFLDSRRGKRSYGKHRRPTVHTLTWLPVNGDFTTITNRWKTRSKELERSTTKKRKEGKMRFFPAPENGGPAHPRKRGYEPSETSKTQQFPTPEKGGAFNILPGDRGVETNGMRDNAVEQQQRPRWATPVLEELPDDDAGVVIIREYLRRPESTLALFGAEARP